LDRAAVWAEIKLGQRVEGAKMNFRMLGHEEELGCLKRALGCDMPKNRRGGGGLRKFGPQTALG
jgi:hypothetical protein